MSKSRGLTGGLKKGVENPKKGVELTRDLSQNQQEILDMLTNKFLTIKQIAKLKSTTTSAIYKTISKLKEKGYLIDNYIKTNKGVEKFTRTPPPGAEIQPPKLKRLHSFQFNISLISKGHNYKDLVGKDFFLANNRIRFWSNKIEIYQEKGSQGFTSSNEDDAEKLAFSYWVEFFHKVESKFGLKIVQEGVDNISLVKVHYSHIHNGIAYNYRQRNAKINVRGSDGKVWLIADFSHNINELEHINAESASTDSKITSFYTNDWRDNNPPNNSELMGMFSNLIKVVHDQAFVNKETAAGLATMVKLMVPKQDSNQNLEAEGLRPEYIG